MKNINADFTASQVTVATTATKVYTGEAGAREVTIENHGTTDVYIGKSGVLTTTGFLLPGTKGASVTLPSTKDIYAIVASGTQAVSVLVTR
jgi:hypothetical protein